jgi:hypothetical protein
VGRNFCIREPPCPIAIVQEGSPLRPLAAQREAFGHRIDNQLLEIGYDVMLIRVDGNNSADRTAGMLDPVRPESTGREDLECLAVKECGARIFCLFAEIVAQFLNTALEVLLGI